jgi:phosphohistidine phosphatase
MTIFLVQHGEAKPETEDAERALTDSGAEIVERMADWAARNGMKVDEIRQSGNWMRRQLRYSPSQFSCEPPA